MTLDGDFKALQDSISGFLVDTTRTANQIAAEDLNFLRSADPLVARKLARQNARLLALSRRLIDSAAAGTEVVAPILPNAEAVDENWRGIVDVIDNLLEKADRSLDEFTGVIKRLNEPHPDGGPSLAHVPTQVIAKVNGKQDLLKPQLLFQRVPQNEENTPFKPLLRSKPHSLVPLEQSIRPIISEGALNEYDTTFYLSLHDIPKSVKQFINEHLRYKHPYQEEIDRYDYPLSAYTKHDPILFLPYDDTTTTTFVDTVEGVATMLSELKAAKEIAIDLEHHDLHSYIGIVCLMQISTREKDWIVDTLKPWREELQVLNEVFADPSIIKVFHGSHSDMIWLQRDLGLYVVGLFDTYHATKALGYSKHGLGYLLAEIVNFQAEKKYQMADWRKRPLPKAMFDYARSDTHFLLFIYDNLRNELIDKSNPSKPHGDLIKYVLCKSKEEALQRYERPFYDEQRGTGSMGWYFMLMKTPALFTKEQFAVFRAVHRFRDSVARQSDESINTVMRKDTIFSLAREMPDEVSSLLGCLQPVSIPVQSRIGELLAVIKQAKASGASGPDMKEFMDSRPLILDNRPKNQENQDKNQPAASSAPSLAEVILSEREKTSVQSLRASRSGFWGSVEALRTSHGDTRLSKLDLQLTVPIPQLMGEVLSTTNSVGQADVGDDLPTPNTRPEQQDPRNGFPADQEIFTLEQLGGSRKRKATGRAEDVAKLVRPNTVVDELETDMMDVSVDDAASEVGPGKSERAKARTRRREAKAQRRLEQVKPDGSKQSGEPFDYTTAPSVLHANPKGTDKIGSKRAFNPYSKSMDAPKGMRKARKEIAGKSHTFKN